MKETPPVLPVVTRAAIFLRLFAIQGAWNYEGLIGNGIGFCVEPALRRLPGGIGGEAYRHALARQSQYFNAHPYLAAVAVGALARVELDAVDPERIERFRKAVCGPMGAVGDRLVWASWLPFCVLLALLVFGLGAGAMLTVLTFVITYNVGHVALRAWGIDVGWRQGLRVASALGTPILRNGPDYISRAGSLLAGVALPLVIARIVGEDRLLVAEMVVAVAAGGILLTRLHGRIEAWKWSLGILVCSALFSVLRS